MEFVESFLYSLGFVNESNLVFVMISLMFVLIVLSKLLTDLVVVSLIHRFLEKTKNKWDDFFVNRKVFRRLGHLVPIFFIYLFSSYFAEYQSIIFKLVNVYIVVMVVAVIYGVINAFHDIYNTRKFSKDKPIKGFIQLLKVIIAIVATIIIISNLVGKSPVLILSGLGAISAILIIVFKDSLLGLVAGIQLTANDMVRIGDWIEMPKYNADGDVIEVSLNTVKVENFDRTITTIPAYALISDSFKNWRGMQNAGGRRIKRSLFIDVDSVSFLSKDMVDKLKKVMVFKDFIEQKEHEIENFNKNNNVDTSLLVNGRRLTNIGMFRAYIEHYLKNNDKIHKEMICMVRQLSPTSKGVPLEVYAFTNDTNWVNYENIQGDIFDHLFAVTKEFGLKIYQEPSGADMRDGFSRK